ncbi:MAG: PEP-CTERM sorting domain-containing protein [Armatimonadota bacterium]
MTPSIPSGRLPTLLGLLPLAFASLLTFSSAAQAQTITYKGDVKLPSPVPGNPIQLMNDSGLNATDLDVPNDPSEFYSQYTNSRKLVTRPYVFTMYNDADGKPYFLRTSARANLVVDSINERHNNVSPTHPVYNMPAPNVIGNYGLGYYRLLTPIGDNPSTLAFHLPSDTKAISHGGIYGGNTTTIFATSLGGNLQLYSMDVAQPEGVYYPTPTMIIPSDTPAADLALSGLRLSQTFGTDGNLYVMDTVGRRIMTFDLGLNGGVRGTMLSSFVLDLEKAVDNSLTMDFGGNLYVGDGLGGFNMYSKEGQWKMGFADTYTPDPNIVISTSSGTVRSYMNFYASGLTINGVPDGNGTLDIYDATGYRQYSITGAANAVTADAPEPGTAALLVLALPLIGAVAVTRRRKNA